MNPTCQCSTWAVVDCASHMLGVFEMEGRCEMKTTGELPWADDGYDEEENIARHKVIVKDLLTLCCREMPNEARRKHAIRIAYKAGIEFSPLRDPIGGCQ